MQVAGLVSSVLRQNSIRSENGAIPGTLDTPACELLQKQPSCKEVHAGYTARRSRRSSFISVGRVGSGGGDRTRDPRPTSPVLVRFHQPKARSRICPNRQRLPKDSATHNGREEAVGRVGKFTALSKS